MFKPTKVTLVDSMGSDKTVVNSARVSFNRSVESLSDKDKKLIKYLADNHHTSPFEHAAVSFCVETSIVISKQVMRHRTFSYNELSRRYTSDEISFYDVKELRKQAEDNRQCSTGVTVPSTHVKEYEELCKASLRSYEALLKEGVSREQARFCLPQSTMTKFYMTGNLLNWFKFLKLRLGSDAQPEVSEIAEQVYRIIKEIYPNSTAAFFK